tara:strand:+ start:171 stop:356 length:186 start_codon:yes stop_codon:yes gene_type:complete
MYNIYEIEQISAKLWSIALKISGGDYEERGLTSRECRALYEIVRASKKIAAKEEYIKEISS